MENYQSALCASDTWSLLGKDNSNEVVEQTGIQEEDILGTPQKSRKSSFVWKYFRPLIDGKIYECIICNSCVGNQTSNLSRHLFASHNISKHRPEGVLHNVRGRPSRSFIWKYCTKENNRHARCHLCNKLLYFGGGNTTNIAKHLHRRHSDIIGIIENRTKSKNMDDDCSANEKQSTSKQERKERKGGSYVWKYCDKVSRHTIRCKLCNKVMSFHGTANVITHLQRKHNIGGRTELETPSTREPLPSSNNDSNASEEGKLSVDPQPQAQTSQSRRRGSGCSTSVVWKYCTRIAADVVRCGFCKKNLSYQGTSNLQRHLHRMHGVLTQSRVYKRIEVENDYKQMNSDFIWQHCSVLNDEQLKCNMCISVFDKNNTIEIMKHLTHTHAVEPRQLGRRSATARAYTETESTDEDDEGFDNDNVNSGKEDYGAHLVEFDEFNIKKDSTVYDDIIVEDDNMPKHLADEDPFDSTILQSNPLSTPSSRAATPDLLTSRPSGSSSLQNSKTMQKLNEERLRMETEYYREKAGFYRMQKYLTALQTKKVRAELEQFNQQQHILNGAVIDAGVGATTFTVNAPNQTNTGCPQ